MELVEFGNRAFQGEVFSGKSRRSQPETGSFILKPMPLAIKI